MRLEMSELYYRDYTWIKGRPFVTGKGGVFQGLSYKILSDSYQKKIVIERYQDGAFDRTIYDSSILDFKTIKKSEGKELWYREEIEKGVALIRDECGRVIALEKFYYNKRNLEQTEIYSPHKVLIARQNFIYLKDKQELMKFYDVEGKLVFEEELKAGLEAYL